MDVCSACLICSSLVDEDGVFLSSDGDWTSRDAAREAGLPLCLTGRTTETDDWLASSLRRAASVSASSSFTGDLRLEVGKFLFDGGVEYLDGT